MPDGLPYLKQVSRVKHQVLEKYLEPWSKILGSRYTHLRIVDCFAGGGRYSDEKGEPLPGSPVIALRLANRYLQTHPSHRLSLVFVENHATTARRLREALFEEPQQPGVNLQYHVVEQDAQTFVNGSLKRHGRPLGTLRRRSSLSIRMGIHCLSRFYMTSWRFHTLRHWST